SRQSPSICGYCERLGSCKPLWMRSAACIGFAPNRFSISMHGWLSSADIGRRMSMLSSATSIAWSYRERQGRRRRRRNAAGESIDEADKIMSILPWIFQALLALLGIAGGAYKILAFEELAKMPATAGLSRFAWAAFGTVEIVCGVLLIVP